MHRTTLILLSNSGFLDVRGRIRQPMKVIDATKKERALNEMIKKISIYTTLKMKTM